jgi:putative acetyltransferase
MADLIIRHSRRTDLEGILALFAQDNAYSNTLHLPYPTEPLWEKRLASDARHLVSLVAEMDGEIVGQATVVAHDRPRIKHSGTFGMAVADSHTGQGIGTELLRAILDLTDNWLNLRRLEIQVFVDNEPAIHLYEKFGFVREGTCRDYAFRNGQYVDVHVMGRIRDR